MSERDSSIKMPPKPYSTVVFFILAFGLSWLVWGPALVAVRGLTAGQINPTLTRLAGAFGPFLAALITSAVFDGGAGVGRMLRRFLIWRVGFGWYLFVLLWPVALSLAVIGIHALLVGEQPDFTRLPFMAFAPPDAPSPWIIVPFLLVQQLLFGSAMGEEIGWRGYALPRLQARTNSALLASVILGALWGLWHLPLALTPGDPIYGNFVWVSLGIIASAVLYTWVFNNTRGSLLLALLFHASQAATGVMLPASGAHPLIGVAIGWAAAIGVVLWAGPTNLSRQPSQQPC